MAENKIRLQDVEPGTVLVAEKPNGDRLHGIVNRRTDTLEHWLAVDLNPGSIALANLVLTQERIDHNGWVLRYPDAESPFRRVVLSPADLAAMDDDELQAALPGWRILRRVDGSIEATFNETRNDRVRDALADEGERPPLRIVEPPEPITGDVIREHGIDPTKPFEVLDGGIVQGSRIVKGTPDETLSHWPPASMGLPPQIIGPTDTLHTPEPDPDDIAIALAAASRHHFQRTDPDGMLRMADKILRWLKQRRDPIDEDIEDVD